MIVPRGPKTVHKYITIPDVSVTAPHSYQLFNNLGVLQAQDGPTSFRKKYGVLSDIVYTRRPKGSLSTHSNFCVHSKASTVYNGDPMSPLIIVDYTHTPNWYYQYWHGHAIADAQHLLVLPIARAALGGNSGPSFLFQGAQAWINDACVKTKPDLTKFDMFNLATQSAGLLHENISYWTPKGALNIKEDVRALYFSWKKNASIVKNVAGQFLGYKFGLAPDIGDLNAASKGLLEFRSKLDKFRSNYGKILHSRVTCLNESTTKSGLNTSGGYRTKWNGTVTRKVEAYIYYQVGRIDSFGDIDETYRALLSTVGLELNPRVAWDAIPFSFVVDWFFNVGKVLERFKIPALELPIRYTDSFLQYTSELNIETATSFDYNDPNSSITSWPAWNTHEKYFVRYPIFADYSQLTGLGFRIPTGNQAILLVALGAALL